MRGIFKLSHSTETTCSKKQQFQRERETTTNYVDTEKFWLAASSEMFVTVNQRENLLICHNKSIPFLYSITHFAAEKMFF